MKVVHFKSAAEFRKWLGRNHASVSELWVGFYKKASGKVGITYAEALDEALCFGWIDGIRKTVDEERYTNRFTPRRTRSIWSLVNTRRVKELIALGRVAEAGLKAFAARDPKRGGVYSFERAESFDAETERKFKASKRAWTFFEAQPPGYRRRGVHYVMMAKGDETRARRLAQLIDASARGLRLGEFLSSK